MISDSLTQQAQPHFSMTEDSTDPSHIPRAATAAKRLCKLVAARVPIISDPSTPFTSLDLYTEFGGLGTVELTAHAASNAHEAVFGERFPVNVVTQSDWSKDCRAVMASFSHDLVA